MSGSIDIRLLGDAAGVEHMLNYMMFKLAPPSVGAFLNTTVDPYFRERARARFKGEGDDVVGKWASLLSGTQAARSAQGYGPSHPINRRTGRLENYITNGPNRVVIDPAGASVVMPGTKPTGELLEKVQTAQQGKAKPRTVARPVLGANERDLLAVLTMMATFIEGQ